LTEEEEETTRERRRRRSKSKSRKLRPFSKLGVIPRVSVLVNGKGNSGEKGKGFVNGRNIT
jgi:hypothetical protein